MTVSHTQAEPISELARIIREAAEESPEYRSLLIRIMAQPADANATPLAITGNAGEPTSLPALDREPLATPDKAGVAVVGVPA